MLLAQVPQLVLSRAVQEPLFTFTCTFAGFGQDSTSTSIHHSLTSLPTLNSARYSSEPESVDPVLEVPERSAFTPSTQTLAAGFQLPDFA